MKRLMLILLLLPVVVEGQIITTIAGNGSSGCLGDGGYAINAMLCGLNGIAIDSLGNIYINDYACNSIRKINDSGIITLYAGNGLDTFNGDNDSATLAGLHQPTGVAVDAKGNIYIADNLNHRIRKVNASGIITTIAGTGMAGYNGDSIPAITAKINEPFDVAVDKFGNVYIGDFGDGRVRKVDTNGIITTIAGIGAPFRTADGHPGTHVGLGPIVGLAVDDSGNVYISCSNNDNAGGSIDNSIRKLNTSGYVTTIAGKDSSGYRGDGQTATSALLYFPYKIAINKTGDLFIADEGNNRVRKVDASGIITTVAGNGNAGFSGDNGPATSCELHGPTGLAFDASGNLYIDDLFNSRIRVIHSLSFVNTVIPPSFIITIFPNPATTQLTIQPGSEPIDEVSIINLLGQVVYHQQCHGSTPLPMTSALYNTCKLHIVFLRKFFKKELFFMFN